MLKSSFLSKDIFICLKRKKKFKYGIVEAVLDLKVLLRSALYKKDYSNESRN